MRNFFPSSLLAATLLLPCNSYAADANSTQNKSEKAVSLGEVPSPLSSESSKAESPADKVDGPAAPPAAASPPSDLKKNPDVPSVAAKDVPKELKKEPTSPKTPLAVKFEPFTGKITKNKVRMRLQSAYDGNVVRELNSKDLVVVLGETEDFYAVQPPADIRAFVFRTFVLDNVIEGNRVNARLKPDLESPVVAQLNSGDRVEGVIHPGNNKWMEIKLPASTRFYIAKEFIEKAGDAGYKARLEKKYDEAFQLLNTTDGVARTELQKPFDQINIDGVKAGYQNIMQNYPEFPEAGLKAKEGLAALNEAYTAKKLAYLENQTRSSSTTFETNKKLASELEAQKSKVSLLEQQIEKNQHATSSGFPTVPRKPAQLPVNISTWMPVEENLFASWTQQTGNRNLRDFYDHQKKDAFILKGIIDPYNRPVKNKPGDYMLLNSSSKLPIAFLYSTQINLQEFVGHEVSILVSPRPNNSFAFPAYFVLQLE